MKQEAFKLFESKTILINWKCNNISAQILSYSMCDVLKRTFVEELVFSGKPTPKLFLRPGTVVDSVFHILFKI